jgi:hypothetical protein
MTRVKLLAAVSAAMVFGALSSTAMAANTVEGSIWEGQPGPAGDATPGNVPGTTPDVTFTTNSPINFSSGSAYTIGEFLSSGSGSTILTGSSQLGNTLDNTIFNFTGTVTVTSGETFTVGHDDGLTLIIGGVTVINAPGPTGFTDTTQTYTGPSGNEPFQLVYGECCGAPADLAISLPLTSAVPEPATWALMLFGVGAIGATMRLGRRQDPVQAAV